MIFSYHCSSMMPFLCVFGGRPFSSVQTRSMRFSTWLMAIFSDGQYGTLHYDYFIQNYESEIVRCDVKFSLFRRKHVKVYPVSAGSRRSRCNMSWSLVSMQKSCIPIDMLSGISCPDKAISCKFSSTFQ